MHCMICDCNTNDFRKLPDGSYESICSNCRNEIRNCNGWNEDIDDDDCNLAEMSGVELIRYIERNEHATRKLTKGTAKV